MTARSPISTTRIFFLCLAKAIIIGLSVVILVTFSVWLLVSPANAQAEQDKITVSDLVSIDQPQQGSLLFKTSHRNLYRYAPLLNTDVSMDITALTARVSLRQSFHNEGQDWVEGVYVFPLPENAAVDHMKMKIGERIIEGRIKEREEASRIYQKAKSSGRKAALIEQERPNMFTTSVANIGPGEIVVITIEYQQTLAYRDETFSIRFPMTVTPRYMPGAPLPALEESLPASNTLGWAINTTEVPDASRISPPVLHEDEPRVNPVKLQVNLSTGIPLDHINSLYHEVTVIRGGNGKASIRLQAESVPADRDFVLEWKPVASHAPRAALFNERKADSENVDESYYSMIMIMPPVGYQARALPREVIFIIDTSGSMGGESIRQARSALLLAVQRLKASDRFNVIQFNSQTDALFATPVVASPYNINRALDYVRQLHADGGTEMRPALNLGLSYPVDSRFMQQVVFLTDGAVGNERDLFQVIHDKLGSARLFTVGIGSAPNSFFMRKAAEYGRGTYTYIGDVSEVQNRMSVLFGKLETPVMRDLKLLWPKEAGDIDVYPKRLPDLYLGEPLIIKARSKHLSGELKIAGQRGQQPWEANFALNSHAQQPGVGVLWARSRIASLMDSLHEGANQSEVRQSVVKTALDHHLVSKYTSLVAVDVTPSRPLDKDLKRGAVPTNLPHGMQRDMVFGVSMTQTATPAKLHMLAGIFVFLLAAGMLWVSGFSSRRYFPPRIPV